MNGLPIVVFAAIGAGLGLMAGGLGYGAILIAAGLALLAFRDPWRYVLVAAFVLPITVVGWSDALLTIDGRVLDARLLLTFAVAAIGAAATLRSWIVRPWSWTTDYAIEWIGLAFIAYLVFDGLVRTGSGLVWGPPVARWIAFVSTFHLARRYAPPDGFHSLTSWVAIGFAVPPLFGVLQFVAGGGTLMNGAVRPMGLGGAGPIAIAFAGQMALLLGCFIVLRRPHQTSAALGILLGVIGTAAVAVSATRLVLATSYAGVTGTLAIGRRWRSVLAVTVIAAAILVLRPELVQRFQTAVNEAFGGGPAASAQASPVATQQPETTDNTSELGDPSLHTRLVVWDRILAAWSKEPILGIGPGMTAPTIAEASGAQRVAPHNDYIGALAELGIIGFCLFVGLQLAVGVLLWGSGSRSPPMTERLGTPARAALVVFLCFNVLGALNNPSYFLDIQVAVWALVGAGLASRNQPREETATSNAAMAAAGS